MIQLLFGEVRVTPWRRPPVLVLREADGTRQLRRLDRRPAGAAAVLAGAGAGVRRPPVDPRPDARGARRRRAPSSSRSRSSGSPTACTRRQLTVNAMAVACRVSDGVALALQSGAPILVHEACSRSTGVAQPSGRRTRPSRRTRSSSSASSSRTSAPTTSTSATPAGLPNPSRSVQTWPWSAPCRRRVGRPRRPAVASVRDRYESVQKTTSEASVNQQAKPQQVPWKPRTCCSRATSPRCPTDLGFRGPVACRRRRHHLPPARLLGPHRARGRPRSGPPAARARSASTASATS